MKSSKSVILLSPLITVLATLAAIAGLVWQNGAGPFSFTSLHGQTVQMYGQGLYRFDSYLIGAGFRGVDAITLVVAIPLLILSIRFYQSGSLRGGILLAGTLAYFLYNYASMAFGAAYNNLLLVYIALFSASLFAFVLTFSSIDAQAYPTHLSPRLPRRGMIAFLFATGLALLGVWLGLSLIPALLKGQVPQELAAYTTLTTHVLDIGVIAPIAIVAGFLLLRRLPLGYLMASIFLVFTMPLGTSLIAAGMVQLGAGAMSVGQAVGFTIPFAILTVAAVWLSIALFRSLSDSAAPQSSILQPAHT
jgi:hypothetical protein